LYLALWDTIVILDHAWTGPSLLHGLSAVPLGFLLSVSFFHVAWLHSAKWSLHGCITVLFCTLLAAWGETTAGVLHPPLFMALWSVLLVSRAALAAPWHWPADLLTAVARWRDWSPLPAIAMWLQFPFATLAAHLAMLVL